MLLLSSFDLSLAIAGTGRLTCFFPAGPVLVYLLPITLITLSPQFLSWSMYFLVAYAFQQKELLDSKFKFINE
jgi:hypothetical protein